MDEEREGGRERGSKRLNSKQVLLMRSVNDNIPCPPSLILTLSPSLPPSLTWSFSSYTRSSGESIAPSASAGKR